ncbi:basic secretory protein-like protein [Kribbella sp. NPDC051586]|uniref:basic secretory protein-like protein n=1 Tax=Kribbella sp. NPDC051586 TaxID=3364118 RepID=UPI00378DF1E1
MNHPKRLFAGVAVLALAASGAVVAVRVRSGESAPGASAVAAAAPTSTSPTPGELSAAGELARKQAIDAVLARRAAAVLKGDLKGFLAPVDVKQADLVARQRLLFVNLRKFGFSSLKYFTADAFRPVPGLVAKFGATTFSTRVMMRYQLVGLDPQPVQTDLGYTFVQRRGAWVLVDDTGTDENLSGDGHRQPWDFNEVQVVRRGKVVVVVDKREASLGTKVAQVAQKAVTSVRKHWARPWNGAVLVVAMPQDRVMSTIWTAGTGDGWTIAAKAVTLFEGEQLGKPIGRPIGSRIVVNPALRKRLDKDLLVHEMTHVATSTLGMAAPIWMVEGMAEYVRCRSIEDDPHWSVDPYRKRVKSAYLPKLTKLPGTDVFDADADRAYGSSWWIVEYLADKLGEKKLAALYTDMSQHGETFLKKDTGLTPAQVVAGAKKFKG